MQLMTILFFFFFLASHDAKGGAFWIYHYLCFYSNKNVLGAANKETEHHPRRLLLGSAQRLSAVRV